jgi:hypothetical protein
MQAMQLTTKEEIMITLSTLRAKFQTGVDQMSPDDKRTYHALLQQIMQEIKDIEHNPSIPLPEHGHEDCILQFGVDFPLNSTETHHCIPSKEVVQKAIDDKFFSLMRSANEGVVVEDLFVELDNFCYLTAGPTSPKYLSRKTEVFVKLGNAAQAQRLLGTKLRIQIVLDTGFFHSQVYQFKAPQHKKETRAVYNTIGHHIVRLKEIDSELHALGAVPGRGGVPVLSDNLVQKEDFDKWVEESKRMQCKEQLHHWLCTRTRVDKRKRQSAIPALTDERIEMLLALSKFDPDAFPVVIEREFK